MRLVTGSSDGKIRIWNILNGECLRVVRGNSQCDAIRSMSLTSDARRLLVNTENAILLMEFEKVDFNYSTSPYLNSRSTKSERADQSRAHRPAVIHPNAASKYAQTRASRSELVCTPNVKLFGNRRARTSRVPKPLALDHSAPPISAKNLKDASLVHRAIASAHPTSSSGFISDSGLLRRQVLLSNINAIIHVMTESVIDVDHYHYVSSSFA